MCPKDLNNRFAYHKPGSERIANDHAAMRAKALWFADHINKNCPDSREKSLAITKIEEAMMWANAAIARHQDV